MHIKRKHQSLLDDKDPSGWLLNFDQEFPNPFALPLIDLIDADLVFSCLEPDESTTGDSLPLKNTPSSQTVITYTTIKTGIRMAH